MGQQTAPPLLPEPRSRNHALISTYFNILQRNLKGHHGPMGRSVKIHHAMNSWENSSERSLLGHGLNSELSNYKRVTLRSSIIDDSP